jgi:hypothetical protein
VLPVRRALQVAFVPCPAVDQPPDAFERVHVNDLDQ